MFKFLGKCRTDILKLQRIKVQNCLVFILVSTGSDDCCILHALPSAHSA